MAGTGVGVITTGAEVGVEVAVGGRGVSVAVAVGDGGIVGSSVAIGTGVAVGVSGGSRVKVGDGATGMGVLETVTTGPATTVAVEVGSSSVGRSWNARKSAAATVRITIINVPIAMAIR